MRYWIVWRSKSGLNDNIYILSIYGDETNALKACNKHNRIEQEKDYVKTTKKDIMRDKDELLHYGDDTDIYHCSRVSYVKEVSRLYFIHIKSVPSGYGSGDAWLYVGLNKKSVVNRGIEYFGYEHNRNEECDDCIDGKCKKKFVRDLKKNNSGEIECDCDDSTSYLSCKIFRIEM